ncbi:DUF4097 family beta strand repeat-containing protein [Spirosoma aerophilum]
MRRLLIQTGFWLLLLFSASVSYGQTPVQVVTKVIDKEFPYTEGQRVRLNGQKADVVIKGWARPTVAVHLRLIAKHPDRAVAEREVAYHQYSLQVDNGQIDLSNRFVIPQSAAKLQSQLKAVYEVSIPVRVLLTLTNSFGDIRLSDLAGDVSVNFEFGKLTLADMGGKLTIVSNYGDIDGRDLAAVLSLKAEKADVALEELGGTVQIQSQYGRLSSALAPTLNALTIDAARTEILVVAKRVPDFKFDVSTANSDIRLPSEFASQLHRQGGKQTFKYQPLSRKPAVIIRNSYNTVIIQDDKTLVGR